VTRQSCRTVRHPSGSVSVVIRDVAVRDAGSRGLGVFALRDFTEGEFIFRRRHGREVQNDRIPTLTPEEQRHLCEIGFTTSAVLLPPGCYINHSCDPNAMRSGVKVFAWRSIATNDEITIDYRLNAFDDDDRWRCECGSDECSGLVVGSFFAMPIERQRLYLPYAPVFIRREHRRRNASRRSSAP
jgi:hypothetical protein